MTFSWSDLLAPLDTSTLLVAFGLGVFMGYLHSEPGTRWEPDRIYWLLVDGMVFFVPLALLRAMQGSLVWERLLATLPLWALFVAGKGIVVYLRLGRRR